MYFHSRAILPIVGAALALSAPVLANRGVIPEDYFGFEFVSAASLSPDGQQVAYVRTVINQQKNRRDASIWLVAADGHSAPRRLTADGFNSNSPRWNPDGSSLAFLSNRNEESSNADSAAGEARRRQI